jgi:hypothetical protein
MRDEILQLVDLGPLPSENSEMATEERLRLYEQLLHSIQEPITDDEACALIELFGPDSCFGLAWSILHLIETAPGWPIQECLEHANKDNEWIQLLTVRLQNYFKYHGVRWEDRNQSKQ